MSDNFWQTLLAAAAAREANKAANASEATFRELKSLKEAAAQANAQRVQDNKNTESRDFARHRLFSLASNIASYQPSARLYLAEHFLESNKCGRFPDHFFVNEKATYDTFLQVSESCRSLTTCAASDTDGIPSDLIRLAARIEARSAFPICCTEALDAWGKRLESLEHSFHKHQLSFAVYRLGARPTPQEDAEATKRFSGISVATFALFFVAVAFGLSLILSSRVESIWSMAGVLVAGLLAGLIAGGFGYLLGGAIATAAGARSDKPSDCWDRNREHLLDAPSSSEARLFVETDQSLRAAKDELACLLKETHANVWSMTLDQRDAARTNLYECVGTSEPDTILPTSALVERTIAHLANRGLPLQDCNFRFFDSLERTTRIANELILQCGVAVEPHSAPVEAIQSCSANAI